MKIILLTLLIPQLANAAEYYIDNVACYQKIEVKVEKHIPNDGTYIFTVEQLMRVPLEDCFNKKPNTFLDL